MACFRFGKFTSSGCSTFTINIEITESSFAFKVSKDEWRKNEDGEYVRSINQIERLFDVSPVFTPAYDSTYVSVAKRSLEDFKAAEVKEDLTEYFKKLRDY